MAQSEKRIPVSEDTFEALGEFKGAGETWNDVLTELMERSHRLNRRKLLERDVLVVRRPGIRCQVGAAPKVGSRAGRRADAPGWL